jgi:dTDP-4-dehydrorhamnose 3,5-epimerase
MKAEKTDIVDVFILKPKVFEDSRGFFLESYNRKVFKDIGIVAEFVQDNHSKSAKGVIRGLHFQKKYLQGKLIRVIQGKILDIVVDIRRGSPTYKKWISIEISDENKQQVWIPAGLAHGFSVLSQTAELVYKTTDYYHPEDETGIRWNDPELNIDWRTESPILSAKDENLPLLREIESALPVFQADSL